MIAGFFGLWLLLEAACSTTGDPTPAAAGNGKPLFDAICARCHGRDGHGGVAAVDGGPRPRDFTDAAFQRDRTDAQIRDAIVKGRAGGAMPPFGTSFSAGDLDGLVRQVRSFRSGEETR